MDYEKKLEEAKRLYETANADQRYVLESLFPELKESEDEKIRNEIILYAGARNDISLDTHNRWLSWLEKQGEPKPYSWKPTKEQFEALDYAYNSCSDTERGNYFEGVLETLIEDLHRLEKQGEQIDFTNKEYWRGYREGKQEILDKYAELEKQGGHKPTDKIEPENTPIEGKFPYNNSSDTLEDEIENIWGKLSCQGLFTATKEGFSEVATHFANYLKKQNPIEWSKEDEDYYDAIIAKLEVTQDDAALTDNQMEFLKSLKQRIGG